MGKNGKNKIVFIIIRVGRVCGDKLRAGMFIGWVIILAGCKDLGS